MSPAYAPAAWENFAVAEVGAAAALAGLLVVAASINISRIMEIPTVIARLGVTLALFTGILIVGTLLLIPAVSTRWLGVLIGVTGLTLATVALTPRRYRNVPTEFRRPTIIASVVSGLAAVLIAFAGVTTATASLGGLYWLVPGVITAFCVGLVNAWVALVEILR
jgi:hypothetical protein